MQDEIKISCPNCHSLDVKICFEQKDKLRLAFDCQQCSNHFFATEDVKVKDFNLKTETISINISIDKPKMSDEELDAKIIQLYKDQVKIGAISLYRDQKNVSSDEAWEYVENLTKYIIVPPTPKSEDQIFKEELIELVREGKRYKAIQLYQEKHECTRQDAKLYINYIVEFHSDIKKPGCLFWFIMVMLLGLTINFFEWAFGSFFGHPPLCSPSDSRRETTNFLTFPKYFLSLD